MVAVVFPELPEVSLIPHSHRWCDRYFGLFEARDGTEDGTV
jgi:hypothetical protein